MRWLAGRLERLSGRSIGYPDTLAVKKIFTEIVRIVRLRKRFPPPVSRGLREQLERALAEGVPYLILDSKVVDADR